VPKQKILVVEDEKHIARFIEVNLTKAGYEVSKAYNGQEALDIITGDIKHLPDLIILDIAMPVMDGEEF